MGILSKLSGNFTQFLKTRNRRELTFLLAGILMVIIVIGLAIIAFRFLAGNIYQAFDDSAAKEAATLRFDIERARLIQK
ncbi:MAG: hypothetical protein A3B16_00150 [Candidatus Zambryskibacteria bacterium RIFCSPLOWO2_01_FULL_45_43]|uniref:Uncharacterized protein n=1 Tax=Candidatus Zambryskibacteria bacterium RIFCSPLOWO2_01_FULL_45_43 TaxID=1802762 RepID=A0A1G2U6V2_9BACT|nr:MAG: hypothetical protein A3B16_00150 [Candidatus Zambryskibacteria bacterium RIFCSPLOWO2_01_FULL_45_43]